MAGRAQKLHAVEFRGSTNKIKVARIGVNGTYTGNGYLVEQMRPKGSAEIAGIKEGDILLKIDNIKISSQKGWNDDRIWFTGIQVIRNIFQPCVATKKPRGFALFSSSDCNRYNCYCCLLSDSELVSH